MTSTNTTLCTSSQLQENCAAEDSGGPWGYPELLKALRARKGWRYHHARDLAGAKFDPEAFDKDDINHQLTALTHH